MLVVVSPEDHTVNPSPTLAFAEAIDAPVVMRDSACGHNSQPCISIGSIVATFLAAPQWVRSVALH